VLKRYFLGRRDTVAGTVYGTIVVLAVLAAGADTYKHHLWRLVAIAATSAVVLWLAHVYSHALGESLKEARRLDPREFAAIAQREYAVVLAAVPPVVALGLGATGLLSANAAIWVAFGTGVVTLAAQGVRYARLEELSLPASIASVAVNVTLGLVLVVAEVVVSH
jgi:hypothetical protein